MRLLASIIACLSLLFGFWACAQDDDGPLGLGSSDVDYAGKGTFLLATLDSNRFIHLASDTLFLHMDSIWSFSNCALSSIKLNTYNEDTALIIAPQVYFHTKGEDCPSPYYRPDTTIKVRLGENILKNVKLIRVKDDQDSILDTVLVRRGSISLDTFKIFIDSLFDSVHSFPLRTKGSPSVLKVVDSLTPQVFLWRTMKSECTLRIDMCSSTKNDTIYPKRWNLKDTNLVPIHIVCADSDSVYCASSRWEDDSTSLGKLMERPDTVWHTSTYYVEEIPKCGSVDRFAKTSLYLNNDFRVVRELYSPDESETSCGPAALPTWFVYDVGRSRVFPDSLDADSLFKQWKSAKVAPSKKDSTTRK